MVGKGILHNESNVISISEFKARCLKMLDQVKRTGIPVLVTKRGSPIAMIVPPPPPEAKTSWLGSCSSTGKIVGDIISPALDASEWEILGK